MNAVNIAICTLVSTYSSALLGLWIRFKISPKYVNIEAKSLPLAAALITTISGFILGMLVTTSMGEFAERTATVEEVSVNILTLDRLLAQYGPETMQGRESLRNTVKINIENTWNENANSPQRKDVSKRTNRMEDIILLVHALKPKTDNQTWLKSRSLELAHHIQEASWLSIEHFGNSIPKVFFIAVVFWLSILFGIFGFLGSKHITTLSILFLCATCVSTVIYLILDINSPFSGFIQVSPEPLHTVIKLLCK